MNKKLKKMSTPPQEPENSKAGILPDLLPYFIQRASYLVTKEFHRKMSFNGMPLNRWRMLLWLSEHQPFSVGQMTERLMLKQPSVTHLINSAVQDGLVCKEIDPTDARRAVLRLTPEGRDLVESHRRRAHEGVKHLRATLGADHTDRLTALLKETIDILE